MVRPAACNDQSASRQNKSSLSCSHLPVVGLTDEHGAFCVGDSQRRSKAGHRLRICWSRKQGTKSSLGTDRAAASHRRWRSPAGSDPDTDDRVG